MLSDFATKIIVILLILFGSFYMWYSSEGDESVKGQLGGNITAMVPESLFTMFQASGFGAQAYCPYINPYMSQLFSAGSLAVGPRNQLHGALVYATGSDCDGMASAIFNYETEVYDLECNDQLVTSMSTNVLSEKLNTYFADLGGIALNETIPLWQCFSLFGVLPFIAMFLFLRDILSFTMLSQKVKLLVAIFASVIAIMTGAFASFIWGLAYLASLSVQATFILVMLVLAFSSVIMSWVGTINAAMGQARDEAAQMASGLAQKYTFGELSDIFSKKKP